MTTLLHREHLRHIYYSAVEAVHPSRAMSKQISLKGDRLHLGEEIVPLSSFSKVYVAGAGKGAGEMAFEVERVLGDIISDGVVAVKHFPSFTTKYIRPIVAGHPTPNENSLRAAYEIVDLAKKLTKDDLLIFLLSGGASSLMTDLPPSVTLSEMIQFYNTLIHSGASINEVNCVRKHLSEIKGGRLAKLCKANIATFIISDVPGNDLSVIGSGPTVADESTFAQAMNVLEKYKLVAQTPPGVLQLRQSGTTEMIDETPKPGNDVFRRCRNFVVADNNLAIRAAAEQANQLGYETFIYDQQLTKNTAAECKNFVQWIATRRTQTESACFIAGGETTVNVTRNGMGGRNQHFALTAMNLLDTRGFALLSAGTDGTDGATDAAGAFVDNQTSKLANEAGLVPDQYLANFDSYSFFSKTASLFITGPTGTNVMDLVIAITLPA